MQKLTPIELEVFRHLFESVAEEMGVVLRATSFSPNIKERLDFSCAVNDGGDGEMLAQAAHIPVHLGSCHLSAKIILDEIGLDRGDVVMLNDPWRGGTHLPDVTLLAPVFLDEKSARPHFVVITRAHHADVGGGVPGSMGSFDEIWKEGVIIPPVKICRAGEIVPDIENFFLANVRTPVERRGDLRAQIAAVMRGVKRIEELGERYGIEDLADASKALRTRTAKAISAVISEIPDGEYEFSDRLDGEGSPVIAVTIRIRGRKMEVDFEGSSGVTPTSLNAHEAITLSAVFYCLRCLAAESIPTNSGCLRPIEITIPKNSIVGAQHPAAVAGGNVETSQRIVDAIFGALAKACPGKIPAAAQGSMNNLSIGRGGGENEKAFAYFETIAGGLGASADGDGASGLHSHMTNTMNTPIEAFENAYPLRVTAYHLRERSGGRGLYSGGEGVLREVEALEEVDVTLMTTRRAEGAYGLEGGGAGKPGRNSLIDCKGRKKKLPASCSIKLKPGERVRLETPGGGGYGKP